MDVASGVMGEAGETGEAGESTAPTASSAKRISILTYFIFTLRNTWRFFRRMRRILESGSCRRFQPNFFNDLLRMRFKRRALHQMIQ